MDPIKDIKNIIKTDKAILGTEKTIKELKQGNIATIYVSSNVPDDVQETLSRYAEMASADLVQLDIPNDELGTICKKPFSVSVLSVRK